MYKPTATIFASLAASLVVASAAEAANLRNLDQTFTTGTTATDDYLYNNAPGSNTWTINGAVAIGDGSSNTGRLFVGVNFGGTPASGTVNIVGANGGGDTLFLNGYHSADPVLGRLGHDSTGSHSGTINIDGGVAVTLGGRGLRLDGNSVTNAINVIYGSLDYTFAGFGFVDAGGSVAHTISQFGSVTIDALITDAAGFAAWGDANGMGSGDVTVQAATGSSLIFTPSGGNTIITATAPVTFDTTLVTNFNSSSTLTDGRGIGFSDPASTTGDTAAGWTWYTENSTVNDNLTIPFGGGTETIGEQGVRVGGGLELLANAFNFGWGGTAPRRGSAARRGPTSPRAWPESTGSRTTPTSRPTFRRTAGRPGRRWSTAACSPRDADASRDSIHCARPFGTPAGRPVQHPTRTGRETPQSQPGVHARRAARGHRDHHRPAGDPDALDG